MIVQTDADSRESGSLHTKYGAKKLNFRSVFAV